MADPFESDFAEPLRALDRGALRRLQALLQDDSADEREQLMRDLVKVPHSVGTSLLGQLVAICDTDPGDCGDQWSTGARMKGL